MNISIFFAFFLLIFSLLLHSADPVPQNNQNQVVYRDVGRDNTLYDKNEYRKSWDYRDAWRYQRENYLDGDTNPAPQPGIDFNNYNNNNGYGYNNGYDNEYANGYSNNQRYNNSLGYSHPVYYDQQAYNNGYQHNYNGDQPSYNNYQPEYNENHYSYMQDRGNPVQPRTQSEQFQIIHGSKDNLLRPWDNLTYWRYNRDAFLRGNNRPYRYPDIAEYKQAPENY